MQEMENNEEIKGGDARVYEVGYLLAPTIAGEEIPAVYGNLKELVGSLGGEVIADEMPRQIDLAYQMLHVFQNKRQKFNTAYFGWVKFFMSADKVADLKKALTLDPNFIRFLTMKTVKENTIATKKFVRPEMAKRKPFTAKKEGEAEEAPEINKEELDKEIEAMVSV